MTLQEKAHLCRMAEHKFLNMPCGIMDQFVTSMAVPGTYARRAKTNGLGRRMPTRGLANTGSK